MHSGLSSEKLSALWHIRNSSYVGITNLSPKRITTLRIIIAVRAPLCRHRRTRSATQFLRFFFSMVCVNDDLRQRWSHPMRFMLSMVCVIALPSWNVGLMVSCVANNISHICSVSTVIASVRSHGLLKDNDDWRTTFPAAGN